MEDITSIKIIAIFVLLVIALVFGVLPVVFLVRSTAFQDPERRGILQRLIGCLNAFAGGVFMGISLIHLLPEVRQLIVDSFELKGKEYSFNWAELCVAGGFFMVVFVEQIVHIWQEKLTAQYPEEEVPFAASDQIGYGTDEDSSKDQDTRLTKSKTSSLDESQESELTSSQLVKKRNLSSPPLVKSLEASTASSSRRGSEKLLSLEDFAFEQGHLTSGRAMILLISLSVHSIFEGLALGLQLEKKDLTDIFIAIALHKGVEAFTIALSLAQIKSTKTLKFLCTTVFAFMSPIGVAIGIPIVLASEDETGVGSAQALLINGVLQGIATGTFMFVTFIEILPHELNTKKDRLVKFACIIVGFSAITLLNALE